MSYIPMTFRVPTKYGDCKPSGFNHARPCQYTCKHKTATGECTLDYASAGPMSVAEIAQVLGCDEDTINKTLARALEKLKGSDLLRDFYEQ